MDPFRMQACESNRREEKLLKLEKGELHVDHVCDFFPSYHYDSVMECSDSLLHVIYKCGACDKDFSTICALHNHLQDHVAGGSYHYDHVCRTAVPKFDTCCAYTQTELIAEESRNSQESCTINEFQTNDQEITGSMNRGPRKARGRPKGSKNIFVKRRKLLNGSPVLKIEENKILEKDVSPVKDDKHNTCNEIHDYNEDTDVEYEMVELKCESFVEDGKPNLINNVCVEKEVHVAPAHAFIKEMVNDKIIAENEPSNAVSENKPLHEKTDTITDSSLIQIPKNKRKMVQPRKVMKQDGKNKFKNKCVFKSHIKTKKKHPQTVQIRQGFTLVPEKEPEDGQDSNISDKNKQVEENKRPLKSKLFKCGTCSMVMSRYKMIRHNCEKEKKDKERFEDKPSKRINCEFCGFLFWKSEYIAHIRTHTGERPYICEKCGKDFARIKYLKKHLITHEEVKPFICNICGAGFCQNKEYKQHMCSHTGEREHVCNVCDATFICKASLLTHVQNIHLGETRFECDVCMRRFFKRSSLNLHRATHFEAALSCQFCSKKFKDSTGLKRHEKIHTGVKNFKCHLCDHAFVQSTPFWSHMEKRHALSKDEARKVHKESVAKAKILKHALKNQENVKVAKTEPNANSLPILQQPSSYNANSVVGTEPGEFEVNEKVYSPVNINGDKPLEYACNTHILANMTNVNHHASVSHINASVVDGINYSHTADLSKFTIVPQTIHYDSIKSDFVEYTDIEDDSASDSMPKSVSAADTLPTSSQFDNVTEHVNAQKYDVELLEKVHSDFRDYSRYQFDVLKHDEQYVDLYDPINYEKVHDLSNHEQKGARPGSTRHEESAEKVRTASPQDTYSGFVKVPDPSLYTWNKKSGHYEKLAETAEAHTINIAELDQYKLLDKSTEIHGLKMSDLLPADKPQDLSFLGIAAYQSYLTSAQGQYFDRLLMQSHYEKVAGDFDKESDHSPYSSASARVSQEIEPGQVELSRVQSPYDSVEEQDNISMQ